MYFIINLFLKIIYKEELKASLYGMRIKIDEFDKFNDITLRPYMIQWSYPRNHIFIWGGVNVIDKNINKEDSIIKKLIK